MLRVLLKVGFALSLLVVNSRAISGPWVAPGDMALRHDIQVLADAGVIKAPVTSWPLSWGDILNDISAFNEASLTDYEKFTLTRVRRQGTQATRRREIQYGIDAKYDSEPSLLRGFENRAREDTDVSVGASWLGDRFTGQLVVNAVSSPDDDQSVRLDGSYLGVAVGNYMLSAGVMLRWWGPGYDGSIILGNNQRPIPAFSIERNDTSPFESKWLSWIGSWDASLVWGQLENDREVPNARFLALRINFRPLKSLEIGLSRTAQWCGSGDRPCDLDTLVKLTIGQDNRGDDGLDVSNEPGNQLAGVDVRWAPAFAPLNGALYAQLIGEDEAGGFPSRYLGQAGVEVSGQFGNVSYRAYSEYAGTSCQFYESSSRPNCGYNNGVYQTGYRYKGRSIGHSADNDADVFTIGAVAVEPDGDTWQAVLRSARLNNEGPIDIRNTVAPTPVDFESLELSYRRVMMFGELELGAGVSRLSDILAGQDQNDARLFVGWRIPF